MEDVADRTRSVELLLARGAQAALFAPSRREMSRAGVAGDLRQAIYAAAGSAKSIYIGVHRGAQTKHFDWMKVPYGCASPTETGFGRRQP